MEDTELKKGMKFILNNGKEVEFVGNGIFRDIKTGKKFLEDDIIGKIKWGLKANNEELVLNDSDEEPLGLPVVNFDEDEDKEPVAANAGSEAPLGTPNWEF
ncbi:MAG: hypothetical protein FVQ85_21035 [Planctomycetes bacterium]|nr:hypothetical protein [Planctomycetota bacterium]